MPRFYFATLLCCLIAPSTSLFAVDPLDPGKAKEEDGIFWFDARLLTVEGQGWTGDALKAPFDRLPAKAEGKVRDAVWGLSRNSAGICVRFASDSPAIHCRWSLTSSNLAMNHMAATGVSGVDLYVKTDSGWRWLATGRPTQQTNATELVSGLPRQSRDYCLYLPLYNGVSSVEVGVAKEAALAPLPRDARRSRPIVFWGTSITQGGCASRTGMVHTAILGRKLDLPVINLGFSGNGKMEPEVAELIAEIDARIYVIDCLPNCNAAEVTERTAPLVAILRKKHPNTPIVLVEDRTYSNAYLIASSRQRNDTSRAALRAEYEKLLKAGDKALYYIEGETLLGNDSEDTVDGSHPTDLGFLRQAEAMDKVLAPLAH
jgi:lysophospholipase L1-like esterase